jgi:hypothetical protein
MKILLMCLLAGCLISPAICSATPPLSDTLIIDKYDGVFFPDEGYWVDLPRTEKFRTAIQKVSICSAAGGIVGRFRLADDKIWLVGLYSCGGDIPLEEIYPELDNPALATWLNGVFFAKIDWIPKTCNPVTESPINMYRTTLRLKIDNGVVTDMQRQENDVPTCQDIESGRVTFPYDQWRDAKPRGNNREMYQQYYDRIIGK